MNGHLYPFPRMSQVNEVPCSASLYVRKGSVPEPQTARYAARLRDLHGIAIEVLPSVLDAEVDVYAPCALGATLTSDSVGQLRAPLVCGAANNQLGTPDIDHALADRGITWVPDYVANAGGLIQVGGELWQHTPEQVMAGVRHIEATTREILEEAARAEITTGDAAARVVHKRLAGSAASARDAG